jgi:protein ImuB
MRLDQSFGRLSELLVPLRPATPQQVCRIFDGAAIQLEAILLTVQELLKALTGKLLDKESGVSGLHVELLRINAPPVSRELIIGRASRDPKHLWRLLRTK